MAEDMKSEHSVLNSSFPVLLPFDANLFLANDDFERYYRKELAEARRPSVGALREEIDAIDDTKHGLKRKASNEGTNDRVSPAPFIEGLKTHEAHLRTEEDLRSDNKTLTTNADVTNISSNNALVDLFYNLRESTSGEQLAVTLADAWSIDPLMTLKIIFNARSIHLGKSDKVSAYKAFGWLSNHHPTTLLANLRWLVRPIIEKKARVPDSKKTEERSNDAKDEDDDFEMVDVEANPYDVQFGVSHGYWKDLLNILVLAANDELKCDGDPNKILNQKPDDSKGAKKQREWDQAKAKETRKKATIERHERVAKKYESDSFYRSLHQLVARLFAEQLAADASNLRSNDASKRKNLSLAAKWAPTFGEFHDKHTFIQTSIAELLFPKAEEICPDPSNRELYIRHAREAYRKSYASPLRKALSVVEREIAANRFDEIKYERVPSLAMDRYFPLFLKKDNDNFTKYIGKVAEGDAKISGAVLLPSKLVSKARSSQSHYHSKPRNMKEMKAEAAADALSQGLNGQWKTLVQRIKDSGTIQSSIGVCDVSGSMTFHNLEDGTQPMDSAIGLSLLLAEVTAPPFGGHFITFSRNPNFVSVGGPEDTRTFVEKVNHIERAEAGYNTDFTAVFEKLILPMALENKLKQEDMVKQIFVFSDMQFDAAQQEAERWTTSFERIKRKFEAVGYELPKLVFWNLDAARNDKPVTNDDDNTALVSGYSQGMLKVFLDGGGFGDVDAEEEVVEKENEDGTTEIVKRMKESMSPLSIVEKAVSHKAYAMLEVLD